LITCAIERISSTVLSRGIDIEAKVSDAPALLELEIMRSRCE